jgi:hypothetical protein
MLVIDQIPVADPVKIKMSQQRFVFAMRGEMIALSVTDAPGNPGTLRKIRRHRLRMPRERSSAENHHVSGLAFSVTNISADDISGELKIAQRRSVLIADISRFRATQADDFHLFCKRPIQLVRHEFYNQSFIEGFSLAYSAVNSGRSASVIFTSAPQPR